MVMVQHKHYLHLILLEGHEIVRREKKAYETPSIERGIQRRNIHLYRKWKNEISVTINIFQTGYDVVLGTPLNDFQNT